jgi:hypothetical protein
MPEANEAPKIASTWPPETTILDVMYFASRSLLQSQLLFVSATERRSTDDMLSQLKAMRAVVTRLDQFRRMKMRQWAAPASPGQTQQGGNE